MAQEATNNLHLETVSPKANQIIQEVKKVIVGKDEIIEKVLIAILSKGHVLIEDIPGVGKTTLALAFSKAMTLDYRRLQFTPDVLPTDVTGFSVYNKATDSFTYKPGAAVCNLFLADEINRTSSKTQSALLEVMEEGRVTVDGVTREMPKPYLVIATQNPIGSVGTQMLPESQLDRFMIRLTMGYPDAQSEINIVKGKRDAEPLESVNAVVTGEDILEMQALVEQIFIHDAVYAYMVNLANATRNHPLLELGLSPRGTIALSRMSQAHAFMKGRDYVIPDDVQAVFHDVVEHRVLLSPKARVNDVTAQMILDEIQNQVELPTVK